MTRRTALGLLAVGAAFPVRRVFGGDTNRPFAIDAERPFRIVLPALASDGQNMEVTLSGLSAFQGGAIQIRVNNVAARGRCRFRGRVTPLAVGANGGLEGFLPIGILDNPGSNDLRVEVDSYTEDFEYRTFVIQVRATQWTVDYINIPPPDANDPDPPPSDLPDEQPRLNELYQGVTSRKWSTTWLAPVPEPLVVSGYFGEQRSFNGGPVQGHHGGTDLGYAAGTPVSATNSGTVVLAERVRVRGNCVVIDHGGGVFSLYGHMRSLNVTVGQAVRQGAVVGLVGSTGLSTGPHLHWELAVAGLLVDGLRWLDGSQGF